MEKGLSQSEAMNYIFQVRAYTHDKSLKFWEICFEFRGEIGEIYGLKLSRKWNNTNIGAPRVR